MIPKPWPPYSLGEGDRTPSFLRNEVLVADCKVSKIKEIKLNIPSKDFSLAIEFFEALLSTSPKIRNDYYIFAPNDFSTHLCVAPTLESCDPKIVGSPNQLGLRHIAFYVEGDISHFAASLDNTIQNRFSKIIRADYDLSIKTFGEKKIAYFYGPGGVLLEIMQHGEPLNNAHLSPDSTARPPRISKIDHVNIVCSDLHKSLIEFTVHLGFHVKEGKHSRLKGDWIDKVTGLNNVDAYYIALETSDASSTLELIQYNSPVLTENPANKPNSSIGISGLLLSYPNLSALNENFSLLGRILPENAKHIHLEDGVTISLETLLI